MVELWFNLPGILRHFADSLHALASHELLSTHALKLILLKRHATWFELSLRVCLSKGLRLSLPNSLHVFMYSCHDWSVGQRLIDTRSPVIVGGKTGDLVSLDPLILLNRCEGVRQLAAMLVHHPDSFRFLRHSLRPPHFAKFFTVDILNCLQVHLALICQGHAWILHLVCHEFREVVIAADLDHAIWLTGFLDPTHSIYFATFGDWYQWTHIECIQHVSSLRDFIDPVVDGVAVSNQPAIVYVLLVVNGHQLLRLEKRALCCVRSHPVWACIERVQPRLGHRTRLKVTPSMRRLSLDVVVQNAASGPVYVLFLDLITLLWALSTVNLDFLAEVLSLLLNLTSSIKHVHTTTVRLENTRNFAGNVLFLLPFEFSYLTSSLLGRVLCINHLVLLPVDCELLHVLTAESGLDIVVQLNVTDAVDVLSRELLLWQTLWLLKYSAFLHSVTLFFHLRRSLK
jgi:hypothetical protein